MFAVISDIHSNLEALRTVLDDIERRRIKDIYCLGDIVGYGPEPAECLDLIIERATMSLCGNHDHAIFYEPTNFNRNAELAAFWTRSVLEEEQDTEKRNRYWRFLGSLAPRYEMDGFLFVHGSPRKPINEYLFPDDVYTNPHKLLSNFERMEQLTCFCGHTHVPGIFVDDPYFEPLEELGESNRYAIGDEKVIINVGSVGQPRDRDPRAAYAIVDGDEVEFVRLEYDIEATVQRILDTAQLDEFLATRLRDGK
ncbi:MAG: metallophosphoesterase family protein [Phycisphaerae bacterium]|nr:metallophosphoesterase family protein [Phycisphaerae bacterium]